MYKKVLMAAGPVHENPPLKGDAVGTWMYEVSKRLVCFEPHIVSIAHPFYPEKEYRDGIYFHRIHYGKIYKRLFQKITNLDPLSYPRRIARIIEKVRPNIVHMHNAINWFRPLLNYLENSNIKTIIHIHNKTEIDGEIKVDAFVGCSKFILKSYKEKPIKAGYYKCIYNGVDLNRFRPFWEVEGLREETRLRFGIKKDEFIVLFVGRISPEKGVEHFIESAIVLKNMENIRFFVVGEIPKKGKRKIYADRIMQMAQPLADKIVFPGVFPPSKMHLLYLIGDVLVLPSNIEEGFGMVTIEAMATGLPVIVSMRGGLKEYIIDGVNGLFIDGEKPAENIADRIRLLMSNEDLKNKLGREGRKTVEERFSWDRIAFEVEKFYLSIIV